MKKAWKVILILALCILILGEIILGVGLLTGGSPERVWDKLNENYHITELVGMWNESVENGTLGKLSDELSITLPTFDVVEETPEPTPEPTPKPTPTPAPTEAPTEAPAETTTP